MEARDWAEAIDVDAAARRIEGSVLRTRLVPHAPARPLDPRLTVRLKLECEQRTGSFKARGATNQIALLTPEERDRGVVATSSGNHGLALAWAARRAGVRATLFMPADVYPNKLAAARAEGARIELCPTRAEAEERCAAAVRAGACLVHPYDAARTAEGAGTVGLEILEDWPEVELVLFPVGGGGLIAGSALAIARRGTGRVRVVGVEPEGARTLSLALEAGEPVVVDPITSTVQGLCPLQTGALNLALVEEYVEGMVTLEDEEILAAQAELVAAGFTVEPAGAASFAAVRLGALPPELLEERSPRDPLRVACVLSGANADPAQLATLQAAAAARQSVR